MEGVAPGGPWLQLILPQGDPVYNGHTPFFGGNPEYGPFEGGFKYGH